VVSAVVLDINPSPIRILLSHGVAVGIGVSTPRGGREWIYLIVTADERIISAEPIQRDGRPVDGCSIVLERDGLGV
jgi:hypothetical protein